VKVIVLCEGSDFDSLIWGEGPPPKSDIGEAALRNPKVDVDHRDIYLRRGLRGVVSIFLHVMNTDSAGSTSYGIRQHGRRRVVSFLHRHTRTSGCRPTAVGISRPPTRRLRIRSCNAGLTTPCCIYRDFPKGEP
jgi:hypothetical protein